MDIEQQNYFMQIALDLSRKALPDCLPNPPVGCVLVRDGQVVSSGYTQKVGDYHAEAMALANYAESLEDVVAFVTLEPCAFFGRTPSCAHALITRKISKVYVSLIDPDPRNNGKGIAMLREAGIEVVEHVYTEPVTTFLAPYLNNNTENSMSKFANRIIVIGTSGSGKTTLAKQLAACFEYPHIEIDALRWGPDWTISADFNQQLAKEVQQPHWVIDGNYNSRRDIHWQQADALIWLDYSIWVCYWRMLWRVLRRVFLREKLWADNRETFRQQFMSRNSMFLYIHQSHPQRRKAYNALLQDPSEYPHLTWIRHRSPRETKQWLKQVCP